MKSKYYSFVVIPTIGLLILLLKSCASISPPPGGDKDIKGPVLVETYPDQNQKNYNQNKVTFVFDERIDISKLKDNIIINPILKKDFETEMSINELIIKFDNNEINKKNGCKTFSIDLRNGVKDANEGNLYKSKPLVYSNCTKIDTAKIKGSIINAFSRDSLDNILVGLYTFSDTLDIEKNKPLYYTYSNKGKFEFKNIEPNQYYLIAFNDLDKNLSFNSKKEKLAFLEQKINVIEDTANFHQLILSKNDIFIPKINSIKEDKEIKIVLNKAILNYKLQSETKLIHELAATRKEILIYKTEFDSDSIPIKLYLNDSSKNDTTYSIKIIRTDSSKFKHVKNIIKTVKPESGIIYNDTVKAEIQFTDPIKNIDTSRIYILVDSLKTIKLLNNNFKLNESNNLLSILYTKKIDVKKQFQLIIKSKCFRSYLNDTNAIAVIKYLAKDKLKIKEEPFNYVTLNIKTVLKNYHLEIIDDKQKIFYETQNTNKIKLENIPNGIYNLRVWIDENNNNYWDGGHYKRNLQPEKTFLFRKIMDVKTNWDIEDINIEF